MIKLLLEWRTELLLLYPMALKKYLCYNILVYYFIFLQIEEVNKRIKQQ